MLGVKQRQFEHGPARHTPQDRKQRPQPNNMPGKQPCDIYAQMAAARAVYDTVWCVLDWASRSFVWCYPSFSFAPRRASSSTFLPIVCTTCFPTLAGYQRSLSSLSYIQPHLSNSHSINWRATYMKDPRSSKTTTPNIIKKEEQALKKKAQEPWLSGSASICVHNRRRKNIAILKQEVEVEEQEFRPSLLPPAPAAPRHQRRKASSPPAPTTTTTTTTRERRRKAVVLKEEEEEEEGVEEEQSTLTFPAPVTPRPKRRKASTPSLSDTTASSTTTPTFKEGMHLLRSTATLTTAAAAATTATAAKSFPSTRRLFLPTASFSAAVAAPTGTGTSAQPGPRIFTLLRGRGRNTHITPRISMLSRSITRSIASLLSMPSDDGQPKRRRCRGSATPSRSIDTSPTPSARMSMNGGSKNGRKSTGHAAPC